MLKLFKGSGTLLTVAMVAMLGVAEAAQAEGPVGTWRMNSGKVTIRVNYCGGDNLCASIAGLAKPLDKHGNPKRDKDNPNPALRSRPVIGLQVVSGMRPAGDGKWKGSIYNADDGGTYTGTASFSGSALTIKACAFGGLVCKKQQFTRVN